MSENTRVLTAATGESIKSVGIALGIGVSLGILGGFFLGLGFPFSEGPYQVVSAVRSIPSTVLIPIFLALFGLSGFFVPLIAVPVAAMMAANVSQAVTLSNRIRRQILRGWGVSFWTYLRHALLFEVAEPIVATMRVAVPFALALEIALDFFLNIDDGLGRFISLKYERYQYAEMYGAILVVGAVGVMSVWFIDVAGQRLLQWKRDM